MELLREFLPGPARRDMVGRPLELDLLPARSPDTEPVRVLPHDTPAGERGVERADHLDVRRVEDREVEASCDGHGHILPRRLQPTK